MWLRSGWRRGRVTGVAYSSPMLEQMPGFLEILVAVPLLAGIEADGSVGGQQRLLCRQDVPDFFRNNDDGEEVDFADEVRAGTIAHAEAAAVGGTVALGDRLDLNALEMSAVLDSDVIAFGIAPRLEDYKAVLRGIGHETEFRPVATAFEIVF